MSEERDPITAEDLEVEGSEAASVAGGRLTPSPFEHSQEQVFKLESEGYVAEACTKDGTLMVNKKTGHKVTVRI